MCVKTLIHSLAIPASNLPNFSFLYQLNIYRQLITSPLLAILTIYNVELQALRGAV